MQLDWEGRGARPSRGVLAGIKKNCRKTSRGPTTGRRPQAESLVRSQVRILGGLAIRDGYYNTELIDYNLIVMKNRDSL